MNKKLFNLVLAAMYAGLIFVSITYIRIPFAHNFTHPGNALVALSALVMKRNYAILASLSGLFIFDFLNGYLSGVLLILLEALIIVLLVDFMYNKVFKKKDGLVNILCISISAGVLKFILVFLKYLFTQLVLGNVFDAALVYASAKMPASFFTSLVTIILVPILYYPFKRIFPKN